MAEKSITYCSDECVAVGKNEKVLETGSKDGLKWTWKFFTDHPTTQCPELCVYLAWKFEYKSSDGIKGFVGNITASYHSSRGKCIPMTFDVELTKSGEWIEKRIVLYEGSTYFGDARRFEHNFVLKAIREDAEAEGIPINERFGASDRSDVVLVVEGKKFHVNKNYLAIHSDYFRSLFFSDFKEKSMDEIPIVDVKYEDFALLLRTIYPDAEEITDETADILLELADRFQMTGLFSRVSKFLMTHSGARLSKMLLIADKHKLDQLYQKCISLIETADHVKKIKESPYYKELSDATKLKLFDLLSEKCKCI